MNRQPTWDEAARAAGRSSLPVRVFRLGEEPGDDLSGVTTADERLAMMWPLTVEAWRIAGLPIPEYPREETPVRVTRRATGSRPDGSR